MDLIVNPKYIGKILKLLLHISKDRAFFALLTSLLIIAWFAVLLYVLLHK